MKPSLIIANNPRILVDVNSYRLVLLKVLTLVRMIMNYVAQSASGFAEPADG